MTDDTYSDTIRAGLRVVLRQQRVDVTDYGSLRRVSVDAGFNKRFLSQFLSGEAKSMSIENLHTLLLHLGITEAECYQLAENSPKSGKLAPWPIADVGESTYDWTPVVEYDVRATIAIEGSENMTYIQSRPKMGECLVSSVLFDKLHPNASPVVIRISGDSMAPTYPDGCRVLVDAAVVAPSPPGVFVLWDGTAYVVARCQVLIGSNPLTVRMTYDNPGVEAVKVPLSSLTVSGSVAGIVD